MLKRVKPLFRIINLSNSFRSTNFIHRNAVLLTDEVKKAQSSVNEKGKPTIFDKIINKEIPVSLLYEDDKCIAFNDIAPQAPVHFLVIPKQCIDMIENVTNNDHQVI